jgi:hypothetical protein
VKIIYALLLLATLLLVSACGSQSTALSGQTTTLIKTSATNSSMTIEVTAQQLFSAYYQSNIISADSEYKGKTLQVTGSAGVITTDSSGNPYVELWGGQPTSAYESGMGLTSLGIQCFFSVRDEPLLAQLTLNQNVTIQGVCASWDTDYEEDNVILDNCTLVEPTITNSASRPESTPIQVNAQQLFSAYYQNNIIAADLEYKSKTIQISGEAMVIGNDDSGTPYIELWGGTPTSSYSSGMGLSSMGVQCFFSSNDETALAQLALNQTVMIQGTCSGYDTDYEEDNVIINNCSLVK